MTRLVCWYWRVFVRRDRCLCRLGLGALCGWLEERYVLPQLPAKERAR